MHRLPEMLDNGLKSGNCLNGFRVLEHLRKWILESGNCYLYIGLKRLEIVWKLLNNGFRVWENLDY